MDRKSAGKKVGPVLVGTPVKPGELEIFATYSAEVSNLGSRREIGLRLSMNKAVLALFIVAGILGFALWRNDRALLRQGLELLRGIATPHASPQNPDRSR